MFSERQEFHVAVKSIQLGQVWRNDADGQDYLVTKMYSEVFTQFAVLRPAGLTAPDVPTVRVKVTKNAERRLAARIHVYPGRRILSLAVGRRLDGSRNRSSRLQSLFNMFPA